MECIEDFDHQSYINIFGRTTEDQKKLSVIFTTTDKTHNISSQQNKKGLKNGPILSITDNNIYSYIYISACAGHVGTHTHTHTHTPWFLYWKVTQKHMLRALKKIT